MAHRPNILALASKISLESLTYTGITYGDPEYRILDPIVDDDMCSVMMRMRLETDFSTEDLAKKTRKSLDFVQTQCDKLVKAGVIRTRVRSGVLCYYYPIWVPGIMEGILSNPVIFGSDLVALGLGDKITGMVAELIAGPGAVRAVLKKYLD